MAMGACEVAVRTRGKRSINEAGIEGARPIRDIMSAPERECITLSEEDTDFIRQLTSNPQPPTQELIDALTQREQRKARVLKGVV